MGLSTLANGSTTKVLSLQIFRIIRYFVSLFVDFICSVTFYFVFLLYECYLKIVIIYESLYWALKDLSSVARVRDNSELRTFLAGHKRTLSKIPNHIVLILGPEKPSYRCLAQLISWCEPIGVKYISFFDHKNGIDPLLLFDQVKKFNRHILHKIKWGKSFTEEIKMASVKQINGYKWEGVIKVNILGRQDTNQDLVELVKHLHKTDSSSTRLSQAKLCSLLEKRYGSPPPDLVIVCGPTLSYFACTPWHLRLSQFERVQSHHNLKVSEFLNCLNRYSHCEQRYGK